MKSIALKVFKLIALILIGGSAALKDNLVATFLLGKSHHWTFFADSFTLHDSILGKYWTLDVYIWGIFLLFAAVAVSVWVITYERVYARMTLFNIVIFALLMTNPFGVNYILDRITGIGDFNYAITVPLLIIINIAFFAVFIVTPVKKLLEDKWMIEYYKQYPL